MSQPIRLFKKGEDLLKSREKLNALVREVNRLRNIQGENIQVSHTANGVLISMPKQRLTIDDKYLLDSDYNESNLIRRLGDLKSGDLGDSWRVRAHPTGVEREVGERRTLPAYRVMWLINDTPAGEGGWITDAATSGLGKTEHYPPHEVPTPINAIGQIGDIVILTADDIISTTADGDIYTLANIRDDAHFHYDPDHDGRIYFTTNPAGSLPTGLDIMGEMICDPALANFDTALGKESGEWRPQLKMPGIEYNVFDWECYEPLNTALYKFPPALRIPTSSVLAHEFVNDGKSSAYSAHCQLHDLVAGFGMGFRIKYSAENLTGSPLNAYYEYEYKVINDGGDLSTAAMVAGSFVLPVPAGNTEQDVVYADIPIVPYSTLQTAGRGCLIIFEYTVRLYANVLDTLVNRLLCVEWKPRLMVVPEPP